MQCYVLNPLITSVGYYTAPRLRSVCIKPAIWCRYAMLPKVIIRDTSLQASDSLVAFYSVMDIDKINLWGPNKKDGLCFSAFAQISLKNSSPSSFLSHYIQLLCKNLANFTFRNATCTGIDKFEKISRIVTTCTDSTWQIAHSSHTTQCGQLCSILFSPHRDQNWNQLNHVAPIQEQLNSSSSIMRSQSCVTRKPQNFPWPWMFADGLGQDGRKLLWFLWSHVQAWD